MSEHDPLCPNRMAPIQPGDTCEYCALIGRALRDYMIVKTRKDEQAVLEVVRRDWWCGGCAGMGAHRRWCPAVVGPHAARLGYLSEQADNVADQVGSIWPDTANWLWTFAARAEVKAQQAAEQWKARPDG